MRRSFASRSFMSVLAILIAMTACMSSTPTPLAGPNSTQIALEAQATTMAIQLASQHAQLTEQAVLLSQPLPTNPPPPTDIPTNTPPPPTNTAIPPTNTAVPPTNTAVPPTRDVTAEFKAWLPQANILLFEDMAAMAGYAPRHVKAALDDLGIPYTDTKDMVGRYKTQLLSGTKWDLVIQAGESRSGATGEFFDYLDDQLDDGASVIVEMWQLDNLKNGKVSQLLSRCGIEFQNDWVVQSGGDRTLLWVSDHPSLHEPYDNIGLSEYTPFWYGDVGDFVKLASGSNSIILAGRVRGNNTQSGALTMCNNGQFILQTYSTHDYPKNTIVKVWANMIYAALQRRYLTK